MKIGGQPMDIRFIWPRPLLTAVVLAAPAIRRPTGSLSAIPRAVPKRAISISTMAAQRRYLSIPCIAIFKGCLQMNRDEAALFKAKHPQTPQKTRQEAGASGCCKAQAGKN